MSPDESSADNVAVQPRHAVILAAGYGSRLDPDVGHKILVEVGGEQLLDRHLNNFNRVGVTDVTIVTGYDNEALEKEIDRWDPPSGMRLHTAHNPAFDLGNGISVLTGIRGEAAPQAPATPCWLTMSDHVFEPRLFERLADQKPWERWGSEGLGGVLAVDENLDEVFDMPDANKVSFGGEPRAAKHLRDIGKGLDAFEVVDVGLFWCDEGFADALEAERTETGDCWTNDAVRRLSKRGEFGFWNIGDARWSDVDTPEDRRHAEELAAEFRD